VAIITSPEHFDVLIVGAGLSVIGAGFHLQRKCPTRSCAILEGRACLGGTSDLFRYSGIRSPTATWPAEAVAAETVSGYRRCVIPRIRTDIRIGHLT
jgi:cation diffusion facilitator CzcD-associated flavoprotein CzcO